MLNLMPSTSETHKSIGRFRLVSISPQLVGFQLTLDDAVRRDVRGQAE
jgi:hypothetical protein